MLYLDASIVTSMKNGKARCKHVPKTYDGGWNPNIQQNTQKNEVDGVKGCYRRTHRYDQQKKRQTNNSEKESHDIFQWGTPKADTPQRDRKPSTPSGLPMHFAMKDTHPACIYRQLEFHSPVRTTHTIHYRYYVAT